MASVGDGGGDRTSPVTSPIDAAFAIEMALSVLEAQRPSAEQLGDLADAIEAYAEGSYYVAKALATASMNHQKRAIAASRADAVSLSELRAAFEQGRSQHGHRAEVNK